MTKRIAVVTGSTRGLGLETARRLAEKDYHVVLAGRNKEKGKTVQKDLAAKGLSATFFKLDISHPDGIELFSALVLKEFGRVDVLVNNAGIMIDQQESVAILSEYATILETTLKTNSIGPFLLCQTFTPSMIKNGYGRIVNVSSGLGQLSEMGSGYPAYRISKTALNAVTRIFAEETKGMNVLVNSVCPGWVRTDMGGPNAPRSLEEGADTIVWAATLPDGSPTGGFFRDRKPIEW